MVLQATPGPAGLVTPLMLNRKLEIWVGRAVGDWLWWAAMRQYRWLICSERVWAGQGVGPGCNLWRAGWGR